MKHLITFILLFSSALLFGQHITNFGLFQQNISFYNPSATAYQTKHYGTIQYNTKLTGFLSNPTTFVAQYEKNLEKINSGIGILMYNDNNGFATYKIGMIQYRYSIKTGDESKIMLGASAGVFHSNYPNIFYFNNTTDTVKGVSQGKLTMNAGVSYQWRRLYAGVSVMNATKPLFDRINLQSSIHYVAHANYDINISERFTISPQAKVITDLVKASTTLNVRFEHYNKFWYLAGVRNVKSFMVGAGIQFWDRLYVGYLYEHFRNKIAIFGPSHEAFITYKIND
jgi:type IX secretion system PorP/SprF family membrane protein